MEENKTNSDSTSNQTNQQVEQTNQNTGQTNQQAGQTSQNTAQPGSTNAAVSGNAKTIAILCYITFIGWIIAIIMQGNENPKSSIAGFHLRQGLGIWLTGFVGGIVLSMIPVIGWILLPLLWILVLILWIMGLISAINEEEKPVFLLGEFYQKTFHSIK